MYNSPPQRLGNGNYCKLTLLRRVLNLRCLGGIICSVIQIIEFPLVTAIFLLLSGWRHFMNKKYLIFGNFLIIFSVYFYLQLEFINENCLKYDFRVGEWSEMKEMLCAPSIEPFYWITFAKALVPSYNCIG